MTIYGGEKTVWGTKNNGFFVSCCRCGWHSMVEVLASMDRTEPIVIFVCNHCGNEYEWHGI